MLRLFALGPRCDARQSLGSSAFPAGARERELPDNATTKNEPRKERVGQGYSLFPFLYPVSFRRFDRRETLGSAVIEPDTAGYRLEQPKGLTPF